MLDKYSVSYTPKDTTNSKVDLSAGTHFSRKQVTARMRLGNNGDNKPDPGCSTSYLFDRFSFLSVPFITTIRRVQQNR